MKCCQVNNYIDERYNIDQIIHSKPKYVYYNIEFTKQTKRGRLYSKIRFIHPSINNINYFYPNISTECFQLKKFHSHSNSQNIIITLLVKNTSPFQNDPPLLLYSHNYNEDLGIIYPIMINYSLMLKCDVLSYDYSGYGKSEGMFSLKNMYSDIETVIDFCVNSLNKKIENIIFIGETLGTMPTLYITSKSMNCAARGAIIINSASYDNEEDKKMDKYDIFKIAKEVMCPVLVAHGKLNREISFKQSEQIVKFLRNGYGWYPNFGNERNFYVEYRSKFFKKIRKFWDHIALKRNKKIVNELDITNENILDYTFIKIGEKDKKDKMGLEYCE